MKVTRELNLKAVKYLGIEYSDINGVLKIADNGAAREFTLDNPKDLLAVVMKIGDMDEDLIHNWLLNIP